MIKRLNCNYFFYNVCYPSLYENESFFFTFFSFSRKCKLYSKTEVTIQTANKYVKTPPPDFVSNIITIDDQFTMQIYC